MNETRSHHVCLDEGVRFIVILAFVTSHRMSVFGVKSDQPQGGLAPRSIRTPDVLRT